MRSSVIVLCLISVNTLALHYKVVSTSKPGSGKEGSQLWFPKLTGSSQINLHEIAKNLEKRSSASGTDVYLIVRGLVDLLPQLLIDGYTVKLDELGTFRLHAKTDVCEQPEQVSARNIRELRVSFRPDNRIKQQLKGAKVTPEKK